MGYFLCRESSAYILSVEGSVQKRARQCLYKFGARLSKRKATGGKYTYPPMQSALTEFNFTTADGSYIT